MGLDTLLPIIVGLAVICIGLVVIVVRAIRIADRLHHQVALQDVVIGQIKERAVPADATPIAVLRHHHAFGGKDSDGIRWCRCGDRYLDGMNIRRG